MCKPSAISRGYFIRRVNRFVAAVLLPEGETLCHVKNTGRCRELFVAGAPVILTKADAPNRKTGHDLAAVQKNGVWFQVDSMAPNQAVFDFLQKNLPPEAKIFPEKRYKNSRFDFYIETDGRKIFLEVKGVTLERDGTAYFPDAPTSRGTKHLQELTDCLQNGYEAAVFFVLAFSPAERFCPNRATDPAFADALQNAAAAGVRVLAYDCDVQGAYLTIRHPIPIQL